MNKQINIILSSSKTIPFIFNNYDSTENNALKNIELYTCAENTTTENQIIKIGKLDDLESITNIDLTSYNSTACFIFYKYINNAFNNENYNDLVYLKSGATNYYFKLKNTDVNTHINGYFCIYTTSFAKISTTTTKNIYGLENEDFNKEIEPTFYNLTIDLNINNSTSSVILSDIELYYSFGNDIENKIKLCDVLDSTEITKTIEYSNIQGGIYLFFKYKNDDLNNSTYNESISTFNGLLTYFENGFFYFGTNTQKTLITENIKLQEIKYNYIRLILPTGNYNCNITHLNSSKYPQNIILTCNNNYYFSDIPYFNCFVMGAYTKKSFTLNDDSTIASFTFTESLIEYPITEIKNISTEQKTIISEKYGLITLYKPTSDNLKSLSNKMLHTYNIGGSSGVTSELVDLSKYILSFVSLPLDVETIGNKEITLNSIKTGVYSNYINDNIITLDFGNIIINGIYNNSIDYKNTDIIIYLPFIGNQKLENKLYMNNEINLSYIIDLFTGDLIAILKINDDIIDTFSGKCGYNIPFITQAKNNDLNIKIYGNNNLLNDYVPKVFIKSNNVNNNVYIDTVFYSKLDQLTDFNIIDDIELSNNELNKTDIDNLINTLKNGVIF